MIRLQELSLPQLAGTEGGLAAAIQAVVSITSRRDATALPRASAAPAASYSNGSSS